MCAGITLYKDTIYKQKKEIAEWKDNAQSFYVLKLYSVRVCNVHEVRELLSDSGWRSRLPVCACQHRRIGIFVRSFP
jgi:hypothetical protein